MNKLDDKTFAMGLLRQAADRHMTEQALSLMMVSTPRGSAVDWAVVRARLANFLADLTLPPDGIAGLTVAGLEHDEMDVA